MVDISRGMARTPLVIDELQMRTFWRTWVSRLAGNGPAEQVTGVETENAAVAATA